MKINQAKEIFEEIVELSYKIENHKLSKIIDSIYPEVHNSRSLNDIRQAIEEVSIFINQEDFDADDIEIVDEIIQLIEKIIE